MYFLYVFQLLSWIRQHPDWASLTASGKICRCRPGETEFEIGLSFALPALARDQENRVPVLPPIAR
jgi:hypothetical protein